MIIIGIAGGTGSGKTTVVKKIIESLPEGSVAVIPQDSYYNDQSSLPLERRKQTNFDHPDAFDWALFEQQIAELRQGRSIEQPTYSYIVCTRLPETIHIEPKEVIIVEGIMSLYDKELRDLMDLKIFVDAEPDERLLRVITRDMVERGHPLEMLIDKYRNVLKPMHDEFIMHRLQNVAILVYQHFQRMAPFHHITGNDTQQAFVGFCVYENLQVHQVAQFLVI